MIPVLLGKINDLLSKFTNLDTRVTALESAPSGGALIVHDVDGTLDKTWKEISDSDYALIINNKIGNKNNKTGIMFLNITNSIWSNQPNT